MTAVRNHVQAFPQPTDFPLTDPAGRPALARSTLRGLPATTMSRSLRGLPATTLRSRRLCLALPATTSRRGLRALTTPTLRGCARATSPARSPLRALRSATPLTGAALLGSSLLRSCHFFCSRVWGERITAALDARGCSPPTLRDTLASGGVLRRGFVVLGAHRSGDGPLWDPPKFSFGPRHVAVRVPTGAGVEHARSLVRTVRHAGALLRSRRPDLFRPRRPALRLRAAPPCLGRVHSCAPCREPRLLLRARFLLPCGYCRSAGLLLGAHRLALCLPSSHLLGGPTPRLAAWSRSVLRHPRPLRLYLAALLLFPERRRVPGGVRLRLRARHRTRKIRAHASLRRAATTRRLLGSHAGSALGSRNGQPALPCRVECSEALAGALSGGGAPHPGAAVLLHAAHECGAMDSIGRHASTPSSHQAASPRDPLRACEILGRCASTSVSARVCATAVDRSQCRDTHRV